MLGIGPERREIEPRFRTCSSQFGAATRSPKAKRAGPERAGPSSPLLAKMPRKAEMRVPREESSALALRLSSTPHLTSRSGRGRARGLLVRRFLFSLRRFARADFRKDDKSAVLLLALVYIFDFKIVCP